MALYHNAGSRSIEPPLNYVGGKYPMDNDDCDLSRAGRLVEENEFEIEVNLPALPPRYRRDRRGWWTPSDSEEHHLDLPPIASAADRAAWMIREMGRAALAGVEGATADDRVFPTVDGLRSLNELLQAVGGDAVTKMVAIRDHGGVLPHTSDLGRGAPPRRP